MNADRLTLAQHAAYLLAALALHAVVLTGARHVTMEPGPGARVDERATPGTPLAPRPSSTKHVLTLLPPEAAARDSEPDEQDDPAPPEDQPDDADEVEAAPAEVVPPEPELFVFGRQDGAGDAAAPVAGDAPARSTRLGPNQPRLAQNAGARAAGSASVITAPQSQTPTLVPMATASAADHAAPVGPLIDAPARLEERSAGRSAAFGEDEQIERPSRRSSEQQHVARATVDTPNATEVASIDTRTKPASPIDSEHVEARTRTRSVDEAPATLARLNPSESDDNSNETVRFQSTNDASPPTEARPTASAAAQQSPGPPAPQNAPGTPATPSDRDVDRFRETTADENLPGWFDVRRGRDFRSKRPNFTVEAANALRARLPVTIVHAIEIDSAGNVIDVRLVEGTGVLSVDHALELSYYDWWFEPTTDAAGNARPGERFLIPRTITR